MTPGSNAAQTPPVRLATDGFAWRAVVAAHGFSWRKRGLVRDFTGRPDIRFVRRGEDVPGDADLLLWGSAPLPPGMGEAGLQRVRVVRVEDGFIRSVGLGADLVRPLSWVFDAHGMYYNSRAPSDLELLLQSTSFSQRFTHRAAEFRRNLVQSGLTKYNLTGPAWHRPPDKCPVVLVVGQVETDASIAWGALDIRTNMALLQAVREARPQAWIVYKPHPDVVAGLRHRGVQPDKPLQWADEIVEHGSAAQILSEVDEVHVMTSLAGFEALLRHKQVFCYGQPFYAGWGLTFDAHPHPRRSRRLTLDELVAGCLLMYPRYVSGCSRQPCTPEAALQELIERRMANRGHAAWWRRWLRAVIARP